MVFLPLVLVRLDSADSTSFNAKMSILKCRISISVLHFEKIWIDLISDDLTNFSVHTCQLQSGNNLTCAFALFRGLLFRDTLALTAAKHNFL